MAQAYSWRHDIACHLPVMNIPRGKHAAAAEVAADGAIQQAILERRATRWTTCISYDVAVIALLSAIGAMSLVVS